MSIVFSLLIYSLSDNYGDDNPLNPHVQVQIKHFGILLTLEY